MKTILVHVSGGPGQAARTQTALDLARAFSGHITFCQPVPPPVVVGDLADGSGWTTVTFSDFAKQAEEARKKVRAALEANLSQEDCSWDWVEVEGFTQDAFVSQTALADIAVVTLEEPDFPFETAEPFLNHVVTNSAAPVLAMPKDATSFNPFGKVLIAWDGSFEAAKAVRKSLPLLNKAEDILALSVGEVTPGKPSLKDLARYLSHYGIKISVDEVADKGTVSDRLTETARAIDASYIVMGAYGHSRLLQTILGGETRRMLTQSAIPIIFAH